MRTLPVIERVLIAGFVLMVLLILTVLLIWHLHWLRVLRIIAANPPRADIAALAKTLPEPPMLSATADAAVTADALAWQKRIKITPINWYANEAWLMGSGGPLDPQASMGMDKDEHIWRELDGLIARGA